MLAAALVCPQLCMTAEGPWSGGTLCLKWMLTELCYQRTGTMPKLTCLHPLLQPVLRRSSWDLVIDGSITAQESTSKPSPLGQATSVLTILTGPLMAARLASHMS